VPKPAQPTDRTVSNANKAASSPSDSLKVEASLPEPRMWRAQAITLPGDPGRLAPAPSPLLRHEFNLDDAPIRAQVHVSSLGIHEVRINGQRVGDHLLSPGWTSYHHRLLADTHDVRALLRPGRNVVAAVLGDGWYRGRLGFETGEDRCRYGDELALILQLEAELPDGRAVLVTSSEEWRAATGEIQAADLYDGAIVDLRQARTGWDRPGYDDSSWEPAAVVPLNLEIIEPRMSPPVREIETRPVDLARITEERIRIDSGQNLAGFVRLRVRGARGVRVIVRHAEVLEPDGALHTRALRSARATDEYVLAGPEETLLEPPFTFHGFRYAEIETTADVLGAEVVAISSDLRPRADFACSDRRLEKLHQNVVWSQRSNFVAIPTDCPQRDERLGWTGDAQAFAPTASTLFHSDSFWTSWLRDLELDQDDELGVPSVVPDVVLGGEARYGRAGWADAATMVPWAVFESYGDAGILERQLPSMRRWVDSLVRRQEPDGLLRRSWQFGDWLDPDAPSDQPWKAKTDPEFIANAFFAWSAQLVGDAEAVIGDRASAREYWALASRIANATWNRWSGDVVRTQTGCAIALRFGIAPEAEREAVANALAGLVDGAQGRVATGFLGTPLVLPALSDAGRFDQAYRMLLRTDSPSWLYQVEHGATTVWERWDAIRPDGSIHPGTMAPIPQDGDAEGHEGHMLSFNHYAYGAVIDWVYRHVAGLAPDRDRPGYAHVVFAPKPVAGMSWARGSVESSFGAVSIEWRIDGGTFLAEVVLPVGTTGTFVPPATATSVVTIDDVTAVSDPFVLPAGAHRLAVTRPAIALSS
jgi:Alpha-L-rhamnosidase N-terminal domain./Bacterial alpha-L-rhamnosidase.